MVEEGKISFIILIISFSLTGGSLDPEDRKEDNREKVQENILRDCGALLNNSRGFHFDLILSQNNKHTAITKNLLMGKSQKWILSNHQVSSIDLESLSSLMKSVKKNSIKNQALLIQPDNLTSFDFVTRMMGQFYLPDNLHFGVPIEVTDHKLLVFMAWPAENDGETFQIDKANDLATHFPIDSQVYVLVPNKLNFMKNERRGGGSGLVIWEIFNVQNVPIVQRVAGVNNNEWKRPILDPIGTRKNFKGAKIRATSVGLDPQVNEGIVAFQTGPNGILEFAGGSSVRILKDLADTYNFSIIAKQSWGYMGDDENGSMTGDGQLLLEDEADLSIYLDYMVESRELYLTPLAPLCRDRIKIYFRHPPVGTVQNIFTRPFDSTVWLTILMTCGLLIGSMWFTTLVQLKYDCYEKSEFQWDQDTILWICSVVCQRSFYVTKWTDTQRLIVLFSLLSSVCLYAAYCSSIISTIAIHDLPIKTLADVLRNGFTILADPYVHYDNYLFQKNDTKQESRVQGFDSDEDAVLKVYKGRHAYLSTGDVVGPLSRHLNFTDQDYCCNITAIRLKPKVEINCGFHVKKGNSLKNSFNVALIHIMETGLNWKYVGNLYKHTKPRCLPESTAVYQNLGVEDVIFALVLLATGFLFSLFMVFVERLVSGSHYSESRQGKRCWKRKRFKRQP